MKSAASAEALTELALQEWQQWLQNRELRQRLQKAVYGDAEQWRGDDSGRMLSEYLREGSVRDSDTGANNGAKHLRARSITISSYKTRKRIWDSTASMTTSSSSVRRAIPTNPQPSARH